MEAKKKSADCDLQNSKLDFDYVPIEKVMTK